MSVSRHGEQMYLSAPPPRPPNCCRRAPKTLIRSKTLTNSSQGLWACGQFASTPRWRNGALAVDNDQAVIHRTPLCPQGPQPVNNC
jgi:hypothetical protein